MPGRGGRATTVVVHAANGMLMAMSSVLMTRFMSIAPSAKRRGCVDAR